MSIGNKDPPPYPSTREGSIWNREDGILLVDEDPPPCLVRASNWKVLPSRGTEAHSVLPLKTSLAHVRREYDVLGNRDFLKRLFVLFYFVV